MDRLTSHDCPSALTPTPLPHHMQELVAGAPGAPSLPSLAIMHDFCMAKVVHRLPKALQAVRRDTAVDIELLPVAGADGWDQAQAEQQSDAVGRVLVRLASGEALTTRAVVHTAACRRPVLPAWARARLCSHGTGGEAADAGPAGEQLRQLPCILTWDAVDLPALKASGELRGRRVAIVGGGMTSAALAVGAADAGAAAVTLLARRPLAQQSFETEVGWWGGKRLNDFRQVDDLGARLAACRRERRQASLDVPTWRCLAEAAAAGRLAVLEGCEVEEAAAGAGGGWILQLRRSACAGNGAGAATENPPVTTPFQQAVAAAAAPCCATPLHGGQQQRCDIASLAAEAATTGAAAAAPPEVLEADALWLACGAAYDAAADPLLAQLQARVPTAVVAGYPWLDDRTLCWPGAPVYLAGRPAALALGPAAGELPGMRLAAERILASLKRMDYAEAPAWEAARARLAVLPPAATAPLPPPPMEAEGAAWVDAPPPRASVARPPHLVDVSDLRPGLPRVEVGAAGAWGAQGWLLLNSVAMA